jgi:molybdopterin-containing oxidoreductase family iron-sulfur binding subunit
MRRLAPEAARMARRRLGGRVGQDYWRALEALADEPAFLDAVAEAFPVASSGVSGPGRRQVLQAMAASLGLAGLAACSDQPDEQALPYVRMPENLTPGQPRHYATAVVGPGGYAQPVLAETHVGRPTKLEGLPGHPACEGAADAFTQAALLGLYDPGRSQQPRLRGQPSDWGAFDRAMTANARRLDAVQGEGFRLLTGPQTSPTFARRWAALQAKWPKARWHVFEPVREEERLAAATQVFGRPLQVLPRLDRADVVVSLGGDLLGPGPRQVFNARRWGARRRAYQAGQGDCRLFVAEATPSLTGAKAQHRLAVPDGRIGLLAQALAAALGLGAAAPSLTAREAAWASAAARALAGARGRGLVWVGGRQPVEVQALGLWLNARLGAAGATMTLAEPIQLAPADGSQSFPRLVADLAAGHVDTLLVLDCNPAYAAPADSGFRAAVAKAPTRIHAGLHYDETAALCAWHAPLEHDLETWGDARAVDGTVSLVQPLVRPFYAVRSRHVLLEAVQGRLDANARDLVAKTWRDAWGEAFETRWAEALGAGFVKDSAAAAVTVPAAGEAPALSSTPASEALELIVRPDPCVWDGRFAGNPWLQELPKPLNKVTWENVLAISPALARELSVQNGDVVRVAAGGRALEAPCWITPGQARRTLTAFLGYGRRAPHHLAEGLGYDANALPGPVGAARLAPVTVARTGVRRTLATTQLHQSGGDGFVRTVTRKAPAPPKTRPPAPSLYPDKPYDSPSWGMSIDTDLCIGCNACVTACDAENNIAMVGRDEVAKGRAMHWLRIDHYADGDPEAPGEAFQPVPCMHCEQAPCEMGCPVNATVHSPDGLNLQVYNRCIGTRTCSSYCPYKVRRFNWFDYTGDDPPERRAQRNPNVTVRSRGVMEKCTYCVQRISAARIAAKIAGRPVADGEVRPACQQTCPTDAIVFGDVRDPHSAVSRRKAQARDYALLEEENTRPRTTYLARLAPDEEEGG